jgi:hypothetical protein
MLLVKQKDCSASKFIFLHKLYLNETNCCRIPEIAMGDEKPNYPARLRALRYILGRDNKLLPGEQFAVLAGMKPGTLRAIESGLRALNSGDESRIAELLGAIWRDEKQGWYCVSEPDRPYNAAFFEFYTEAVIHKPDQFETDSGAILYSLDALERSLPRAQYRSALLAVHRLILNIARASSIPPKEIEFIELMQPIKMSRNKPRGDSEATKKTQRQRRLAQETVNAVGDMQKLPVRKTIPRTAA